jgi:hypothetical protein
MLLSKYLEQFRRTDGKFIELVLHPHDFIEGATGWTADQVRITYVDWQLSHRVILVDEKGITHIFKDRMCGPYGREYIEIVRPKPDTFTYDGTI